MPRGMAPVGAPGLTDDRFAECLEAVHGIHEAAFGWSAACREDYLLVDLADKLAGGRWNEWLIARTLWDLAQPVRGTTASVKRFHEVFYKKIPPEEGRKHAARRDAYQSAVASLRPLLEGADPETVVKGAPPGPGGRRPRTSAKGLGRLLHEDQTGQLWEVPLPRGNRLLAGQRGIRMVRVVDVRPEPDGTHSVYWLFVTPEVETARQAVAWTFGVNPDHYWPTVEA